MYLLPTSTLAPLTTETPLTVREALSGIFGAVSVSCWIFFLLPQVVENYRNQSAEALSFVFLVVWLSGDVTNFFGGLWANQIPTAIALSAWFLIMDFILITQSMYYNIRNRRQQGQTWLAAARASISGGGGRGEMEDSAAEAVTRVRRQQQVEQYNGNNAIVVDPEDDEEQPLLKRTLSGSAGRTTNYTTSSTTETWTAAQRRTSFNAAMVRRRSSMAETSSLVKILEENDSATGARHWVKNIVGVLGVLAIGTAGWFVAYKTGLWQPVPLHDDQPPTPIAGGAQVLGYASAVLYLGARIPQIIKNWREKSCEGLSLLFFIFSTLGNLSYGIGILCHSTERTYVITNIPWLIGSLGTIAEDILIFMQFRIYGTTYQEVAIVE